MAKEPPTYDLVLLLDPAAESATRKKILADAEKLLTSNKATIVGTHDWGRRKTAYEIDKKSEAEYHLIQFQGPSSVPAEVGRVLRITDGVIRHRVVKLAPGTPPPPDLKASAPAATPVEAAPVDDEAPAE